MRGVEDTENKDPFADIDRFVENTWQKKRVYTHNLLGERLVDSFYDNFKIVVVAFVVLGMGISGSMIYNSMGGIDKSSFAEFTKDILKMGVVTACGGYAGFMGSMFLAAGGAVVGEKIGPLEREIRRRLSRS